MQDQSQHCFLLYFGPKTQQNTLVNDGAKGKKTIIDRTKSFDFIDSRIVKYKTRTGCQ
jgi:hypothetical protein